MTDHTIGDLAQDIFFPMLDQLARIADALERLGPLADYATLLHTEKTGEQVYEVQRYVVGVDGEGQPCIWLYATHPGLNFAVTRVYHDHLSKLPYPIDGNAKVFDGEQAPSSEAAAKKGYFCAFPAPFTVSLMPTGKLTDKGHPIRRLHRVLGVIAHSDKDVARECEEWCEQWKKSAKVAEENQSIAASKRSNSAPAAPAKANGNGKPAATSEEPPAWPDSTVSDAEFENMPSAAEEPAQAAALAQAASQPQTPFQEAAAVLGEIERLTATKMQRFPGTAKPETYAILKGEVHRLVEGKEAQVQVLAYLLAAQAASVIKPDWLPNGARCAAVLDHLTAKDENGKPVMPLHVATGRVRDLKAILALATEQPKF